MSISFWHAFLRFFSTNMKKTITCIKEKIKVKYASGQSPDWDEESELLKSSPWEQPSCLTPIHASTPSASGPWKSFLRSASWMSLITLKSLVSEQSQKAYTFVAQIKLELQIEADQEKHDCEEWVEAWRNNIISMAMRWWNILWESNWGHRPVNHLVNHLYPFPSIDPPFH